MRRSNNGQALVEFVLSVWIFIFAFEAVIVVTRLAVLRQQALNLTALGADLSSLEELDPAEMEAILDAEAGRIKPPFKGKVTARMSRFRDTPASVFYNLAAGRVSIEWPFSPKAGFPLPSLQDIVVMEKEKQDDYH